LTYSGKCDYFQYVYK